MDLVAIVSIYDSRTEVCVYESSCTTIAQLFNYNIIYVNFTTYITQFTITIMSGILTNILTPKASELLVSH